MVRKGRPLKALKAKDYNGTFLSDSDQLIIAVLRKAPRTFTKLQETTRLSTSTLSDRLKKLEDLDYVERSPNDKRIIQLTPKASSPQWKTLQNLAAVCPTIHLDIDAGVKLLTDNVVNALLVISTLGQNFEKLPLVFDCPHPSTLICYKDRIEHDKKAFPQHQHLIPKIELNEYHFLKGLSRFNHELKLTEDLDREIDPLRLEPALFRSGLYSYEREFVELLKRGTEDPEIFPALGVARQTGTVEQFESILDWIRPLIEGLEFAEGRKIYQEDRVKFFGGRDFGKIPGFEMKSITWFSLSNLAAIVFSQEKSNYLENVLFPLWSKKLRSSLTGRKGKGKGR